MSFQHLYPSSIGDVDKSLYLNFTCYDYKNAETGFSERGSRFRKQTSIDNLISDFDFTKIDFSTVLPQIQNPFSNNNNNNNNNNTNNNNTIFNLDNNEGKFNNASTANTKELLGTISLYLPPKIESKYSADWQKMQFGALGAGFGDGSNPFDIGGAVGAAGATGASYLLDLAKSFLQNTPQVENFTLNGLVGATLGISFNDNTIQTFNKMNPRTFEFEYIMIAKNKTDVANIKRIIKQFKRSMHPSAEGNRTKLVLSYPLVWRITPTGYRIKNSNEGFLDFMPKTDLCGLVDMKVDYTPDNNISLNQAGFVQAVRLNLSFTELITLTREDIDEFNY
jgi:hypothetical protein|tara:strand:- start:1255 stop:2262 length:1008 start_codon:yes stop_codon:yes gene_type:complete